jgi:hypothetical protein
MPFLLYTFGYLGLNYVCQRRRRRVFFGLVLEMKVTTTI